MESMGVVVRRYIDYLILFILTPLVSVLFCSSIPTFCSRQPYEGLHIMFYTRRSTHKRTLHILRWDISYISYMPLGGEVKVEGVRYIEMHRGPHTC